MADNTTPLDSTALQVNLERTAATVTIPEKHRILLAITEGHYGLSKKTTEFLVELNHPFVNWIFVLKELKNLSVGDFYSFNSHPDGARALETLADIYFDIIDGDGGTSIKENAIRFFFEFFETLLSKSGSFTERNRIIVPPLVESLCRSAQKDPSCFKKSSTYVKKILPHLTDNLFSFQDIAALEPFLSLVFRETYSYWLTQPDPALWFEEGEEPEDSINTFCNLIHPLTHRYMKSLFEKLDTNTGGTAASAQEIFSRYIDMPDYWQITNGYLIIADELERSPVYAGREHLVKLRFLFNIMKVPGLSDIYMHNLREINRCLRAVFKEEKKGNLADFITNIFALLSQSSSQAEYRGAVLECINTIAREVFSLNDHPMVNILIDKMVCFGFQHPEIRGTTTEWQVQVNPLHIVNIRSWLEVASLRPRWTKRLISALIVNLKVGGVFVRDTDLLQKDISNLLNSDIAPVYNLTKQLLRMFPVYFREIGAEGELRDVSTRVDELSYRKDKLINFLRKQSHVESNSLLVSFIEDIFRYWSSGDSSYIEKHVPAEVLQEVSREGVYFSGPHRIMKTLYVKAGKNPLTFLEWDKTRINRELDRMKGAPERDIERVSLMIRFYQLLYKKYYPQHVDLLRDLEATGIFKLSKIRTLKHQLTRNNFAKCLDIILDFLTILKNRILSPAKTVGFENIYYKRHIAAGIPSMYGSYQEPKFDAVGLSLRLEYLATVLFEKMVESMNMKFITKSTLTNIRDYLTLYIRALDLEGISTESLSAKINYISSALQLRQFSVDQYIDIFQFISKGIQDIIREYYIAAHHENLPVIIRQITSLRCASAEKDSPFDDEEMVYQESENLIRSLISSAFGLQVLDNFVNAIIRTLSAELDKFKNNKEILNLVMNYNPDLTISSIYSQNSKTDNQILIGNKGYFLKQLARMGFPVPQGFIISTEVFRGYDAVVGYKYIFNDLSVRIFNELVRLEKTVGRKYGDPNNPLLLSVRSGATISLPGMMHSFLNVGINEHIAEGLAQNENYRWAAWDCYRRFLQMWGMFQGLDRDFFDNIMNSFKERYGVSRKMLFSPDQIREVTFAYKEAMKHRGIEIPNDPYQQLQEAILLVFASWYSDQAKTYRHQMHISDEWGTAVIVQTMVFGNLNDNSGSGVIFTREPKGTSSGVGLYGDFIFGVQGDDIVSGLVETYPISNKQAQSEKRGDTISLESRFPQIYGELKRLAEKLVYEKGFNHQEIEFTFEQPTREGLYILQTRDMVQTIARKLRILKDTPQLETDLLGTGIGVSGGALCGKAVYAEDDISFYRKTEPDTPLILIRPDTVPEDVGILLKVDGLLTARGGGTSHAAVTIPQLNKVGVVGFSKLRVYEAEGFSTIDSHRIERGDYLCIDGWSGMIYRGKHDYEPEEAFTITI